MQYPGYLDDAKALIGSIDLSEVILDIMLSFLLFAGALHMDFKKLKEYIGLIITLASVGVIVSAILVAGASYIVLGLFDIQLPFMYLLLFGVLISPTDPIAVLGILKEAKVPKKLEIKIAGESLFNDGVAVVVFIVLMSLASNAGSITTLDVVKLFGVEVIGGLLLGGVMGYIAYRLMRSISNYEVEVLITLALVMATHVTAVYLHMSAPLAVVVAGLLIGNRARETAMEGETELYIDKFWELVDLLLNAILFVLIGLELLLVEYHIKLASRRHCAYSPGCPGKICSRLARGATIPETPGTTTGHSNNPDMGWFARRHFHRAGLVLTGRNGA